MVYYNSNKGHLRLNYGFTLRWSDPLLAEQMKVYFQILRPGESLKMKKAEHNIPIEEVSIWIDFFNSEDVIPLDLQKSVDYQEMDSIYFRIHDLVGHEKLQFLQIGSME